MNRRVDSPSVTPTPIPFVNKIVHRDIDTKENTHDVVVLAADRLSLVCVSSTDTDDCERGALQPDPGCPVLEVESEDEK